MMELDEAARDFKDYGRDVAKSGHSDIENNLRRFAVLFEASRPLAHVAAQVLPTVDFDSFCSQSFKSNGMSRGSIAWPGDLVERVALQLELIKRLADGRIRLRDFCMRYFYAGTRDYEIHHFFKSQLFSQFHRDLSRILEPLFPRSPANIVPPKPAAGARIVDDQRLEELRVLLVPTFDLTRLIRLCEELNLCHGVGASHAVAMLTRSILDHVPPLFGCKSFGEVASNVGGTKSFREAMDHLERGARKIADAHLHTHIRASEVLPTPLQVNFAAYMDLLLSEIVRRNKATSRSP